MQQQTPAPFAQLFLTLVISLMVTVSAPAVHSESYTIDTIAKDLNEPWSLAFLPDGNLLIAELGGQLRQLQQNGVLSEPIANVPAVYRASQGGLFDVLLHQDFVNNRTLYLSYAGGNANANGTYVASAKLSADAALIDVQILFYTQPDKDTPVHYGGRLAWLPDGHLLLTTGDGFDYREAAQSLQSHLGKTIRMTATGEPAADNPFPNAPYVWTYGHRNAQGLAVSEDGRVYLHEHGPQGGDEVNILSAGTNYGWPAITYGLDYNGAYVSPLQSHPGMAQPIHYWTPSIAPSGLTLYTGDAFPNWRNNLFVGALIDGDVRRLRLENGAVIAEERLFTEIGERIRDIRTGPDGFLYILTDGPAGRLLRIKPARAVAIAEPN